jgi:PKHD-type hydroxylase
MLLHVPEVLGKNDVADFRSKLDAASWTDGKETVGAQGALVKRNLQLPDASPLREELGQRVLRALAASPLYFAAALPLRTLPPRFNRYEGGGAYGFHVDGSVMALPTAPGQSTGHLRTDIACTLFLSEPDAYDGGELVISDTYGEHEIKLPSGDLIVYPASSLHTVQPVTRGTRLASFFWVQSMVRDDTRRRLLFELDTSIQTLTRTGADTDAVLTLTSTYHNLLRLWAET